MLSVQNLVVDIDGSPILRSVSLDVAAGELVCLVGRNGAGKSTTFRTIMGQRAPVSGSITLEGRDLKGLRPFAIARLGIGFAPEESEVFGDLTVAENILLPTWTRETARSAAEREALAYRVFPKLERYRARGGQQLSGGERKMVSIARAMALDPRLLLLDEPFEGLSPAITEELFEAFNRLRYEIGMVIVDHHLDLALALSDRTVILERGSVTWTGASKLLRDDLELRRQKLWM